MNTSDPRPQTSASHCDHVHGVENRICAWTTADSAELGATVDASLSRWTWPVTGFGAGSGGGVVSNAIAGRLFAGRIARSHSGNNLDAMGNASTASSATAQSACRTDA